MIYVMDYDDYMKRFYTPDEIRELRLALMMTQREFSIELGVDSTTICRWETGASRPHPIAQKQLEKMAVRLARSEWRKKHIINSS